MTPIRQSHNPAGPLLHPNAEALLPRLGNTFRHISPTRGTSSHETQYQSRPHALPTRSRKLRVRFGQKTNLRKTNQLQHTR